MIPHFNESWRPNAELSPKCPRCSSPDTKFCYYNNYSLSQPRYLCKACRGYWTRGGPLRNIPVRGGARKKRGAKLFKPGLTGNRTRQIQDKGTESGHGSSSSSSGSAASSQASGIDLSEIYAKYLNPTSKLQNDDAGQRIISEPVTEETLSTHTDHLLLGELDNFTVDGANINYFFDMSCTDDSALGWRGPNDGLGTESELNSLIYYDNTVIFGIEEINDYEQASFIESYVPSFTCN